MKRRKVGDILLKMEPLLEELSDSHELQWGEILSLIRCWLEIHRPDSQEVYLDGTNPEYHYGVKK